MSYNHAIVANEIRQHNISKLAKRKKTICERLNGRAKDFFILFLDTSSIHGLNHFTKFARHPIEIIFWIAVVIVGLWGAVSLSQITWKRYQDSPTVISMDRDMFAWNTTFPCITVCPHTKIDDKKMLNFIAKMKPKNRTALENFVKGLSLASATFDNVDSLIDYPDIDSSDYMQLLVNLSMEFNPTLTIGASGISLFLQPTITEFGLCYAVNSLLAAYNSPEFSNRWDIMNANETFFVHPLDGEVFAQIINIKTGYDLFIHGPLETPDVASRHQFSEDGFYMKIYVTAISIYTSSDAAALNVAQRKCRFSTESNLQHSPVYSYNLCRIDCRIKQCINLCGCVPHFYRNMGKEKVCDIQGLKCLKNHQELLLTLSDKSRKNKICECLPNCDDVNYIVQSMSLQRWFLGTNLQWGIVSYPKLRYRRDIIFGFTDVLVSVGGMAGLFLGCSVLSFMEIVYFYTLRLFWYIYNNTKQKKINKQLLYNHY